MRKIKPRKKDVEKKIEKKRRKIDELMQELFKYHGQLHDEAKTMETVAKIAELEPEDPAPAEKVASIYVDYHRANEADKAVKYLEEHFPVTPYRMFLRSRVCDLKQDYGGCIEYSEKALTLPNVDLLTRMMIYNILGHAYRYAGDAPNSLKYYELSAKIDPEGVQDPNIRVYVDRIKREDYSNFLFSLHNVNVSREKMFEEIYGFNELYDNIERFTHDPATHPKHEKIRIGYISPDIRRHVVAFFSYAFYKCYDKTRFEVYIYAKNREDAVAMEFKKGVDHFRNILFDAPEVAAKRIKDDEIDILVDLSGHTANNVMGVVAYKPAPVIISAIGWFNTTGFKPIDYFMVDKYTDPVGLNEKFFSEKMLRLQHSHFCYMWHDDPTVVNPAPCTKNGYVTFVSFNNFTKVTDEALQVWAKIVNAVPNAKLYLKGKAFRDQYGTDRAIARIEAAGLPREKLIYEPDELKYLQKYSRADIALDTFPYPGGGTTCDALYMGLPVITLVQERHNSRFGYSLLNNVGLGELCAFSEEEYIQKAVELANDWERIRDYHLTIRRKMEESPVMNDMIYMGEVEEAYEKIYHAWMNGEELPEFPQDAPPVTVDDSKRYYDRAMEYIDTEEDFYEGRIKNQISVKRALYNLEMASKAKNEHDAEIYFLIATCKQMLSDYAGAYESICKVGGLVYDGRDQSKLPEKFMQRYHAKQAELDLLNGKPSYALDNFKKAVDFSDDLASKLEMKSAELSTLNYLDNSNEDIAAAHFEYHKLLEEIDSYDEYYRHSGRMRIAYISQKFCKSDLFTVVYGMIASHDRSKFEVTCYSLESKDDPYAKLFQNQVEHFVDVHDWDYDDIAARIHKDMIDVLVDLTGHTRGNAMPVMAYRPAPLQISGIGYMTTTGTKSIDYYMTDAIIDPLHEHEKFFAERLLSMPSQFCYAQREDVPKPEFAPCTKVGYVVFGTICEYSKITDNLLEVWKTIISNVPNSVLLMRAEEFKSNSIIDVAYERMKKIGFNMDQVLFRPMDENYMAEMIQLDMILDSYPYGGGTMILDAIYMGVPVISIYGERRSTRVGLDILTQIDMKEMAVDSWEKYIEVAIGLANDQTTLDTLHKNLRRKLQEAVPLRPRVYTGLLEDTFPKLLQIKIQAAIPKPAE